MLFSKKGDYMVGPRRSMLEIGSDYMGKETLTGKPASVPA
jgi:hypothetical protein